MTSEVIIWPRFPTYINQFINLFFSFVDTKEGVLFPKTILPSEYSSTPGDPLIDFPHQHLTDVKNKGIFSDQISPSLCSELNCSPGLCSVRIRFLANRPSCWRPKAETILKSHLFPPESVFWFFQVLFLWAWLQYSCYSIWDLTFFPLLMLCTFQMYSLNQFILSPFHVLEPNVGRLFHPWREVNVIHFVSHA